VPAVVGKANPANVHVVHLNGCSFPRLFSPIALRRRPGAAAWSNRLFALATPKGVLLEYPSAICPAGYSIIHSGRKTPDFITTFEKRDGKWRAIKIRVEGAEE